tara:strand:- start:739 stop:2055 length:1317 start_codon:yes stop_codon:yes gene_type:complete
MNVSVFGLGYVGCVTVGCLSKMGHNIIGVDTNTEKLKIINKGKSTVVENGLNSLIRDGVKRKLISTTSDPNFAVMNSDIAIICVGTPNDDKGFLEMKYIENVVTNIGYAIKNSNSFYTISIRSTVNPGTNELVCSILEDISGKKNNIDFGVVSNPEFLREGSAISDFFHPPYTVLASSSNKALDTIKELYNFLDSPIETVDIKVAELIKFLNNSFHALKVAFGNEVGRISHALNLGDNKLIELFLKDKILNISEIYYKPGFSYGGSCLPKDLMALNSIASNLNINLPLLNNVEQSNTMHTKFILERILKFNIKNVGIYGLAFKKGTDDLRFSKSLDICEQLLGKGKNIYVYDRYVNISKIIGSNKDFLDNKIPHINKMLVSDFDNFTKKSNLIVLIHKPSEELIKKLLVFLKHSDNCILDLSLNIKFKKYNNYYGCNW